MSTAELKTERPGQPESRQPAAVDVWPPPARPYLYWKGVLDRSLAALLLIPALPVMGLLVVLVRWTSRGPGIFRQARVGQNGVTFMMYKIRTMRVDAEAATGAVWAQPGDSRVTGLGRYLRKLHLDELPQLFNVLRGQMSLVGPRPERPEFVEVLAEDIPDYLPPLAVRPGVTGLAQINLPPDMDLDSVRRKQVLDLEYIRTVGPWLDARMLLCTSLRLFGCSGQSRCG
jgi:lipopolysaccharide/colanic/teichoic acid biosynthesis glycosyltransferase